MHVCLPRLDKVLGRTFISPPSPRATAFFLQLPRTAMLRSGNRSRLAGIDGAGMVASCADPGIDWFSLFA